MKVIEELRGKINHRGLLTIDLSYACVSMCQVDSHEQLEEDTTMSYQVMNRTMQANIHMTCYKLLASWS